MTSPYGQPHLLTLHVEVQTTIYKLIIGSYWVLKTTPKHRFTTHGVYRVLLEGMPSETLSLLLICRPIYHITGVMFKQLLITLDSTARQSPHMHWELTDLALGNTNMLPTAVKELVVTVAPVHVDIIGLKKAFPNLKKVLYH